jgi:hypothetical protein
MALPLVTATAVAATTVDVPGELFDLRTTLAGTAKAAPSSSAVLHCSQRELSWHWVRVWGRMSAAETVQEP